MNLANFSLPDIARSDLNDEKQRRMILEYLYQLTEQLRYVLNNIGAENLSDELTNLIDGAYSKALTLSNELQDAWGNISSVKQTAQAIQLEVKNAQGDIASLQVTATGLQTQVTNAKGDIATLQVRATGIETRVTNAEGDVTTLKVTASGLQTQVTDTKNNVTSLQVTASGLQTQVTNANNSIASVKAYAESITLSVSNGSTSSTVQLKAGSTVIASQAIQMSGLVSFTNLSTAGATTINGSNITTGTIDASKATITNINASNINAGTLAAARIDVSNLYVKHLSGADGTFAGSLSAATGSFSGSLNAASGTFAGSLSSASGTFSTLTAAGGTVAFYPNFAVIGLVSIGKISGYSDTCVLPSSHQTGNVGVGSLAWDQCVARYLYSSSGSVSSYSMRALKENIVRYSEDIIMKLRPVRYNMIDDPEKVPQIGFIADNIMKYCPELVRKFKDCSMKRQVLTLTYDRITVILVDEAQRQRRRLNKVEKRADKARGRMAALRRRVDAQDKIIAELAERLARLEAKEA